MKNLSIYKRIFLTNGLLGLSLILLSVASFISNSTHLRHGILILGLCLALGQLFFLLFSKSEQDDELSRKNKSLSGEITLVALQLLMAVLWVGSDLLPELVIPIIVNLIPMIIGISYITYAILFWVFDVRSMKSVQDN